MPTINQSVDVEATPDEARREWNRFVNWVQVGNYRFWCDEFSCERAADRSAVQFQSVDDTLTRVSVEFDYHDDDSDHTAQAQRRALLHLHLQRDLWRFKDFLEQREDKQGIWSRLKSNVRAEGRRGNLGHGEEELRGAVPSRPQRNA